MDRGPSVKDLEPLVASFGRHHRMTFRAKHPFAPPADTCFIIDDEDRAGGCFACSPGWFDHSPALRSHPSCGRAVSPGPVPEARWRVRVRKEVIEDHLFCPVDRGQNVLQCLPLFGGHGPDAPVPDGKEVDLHCGDRGSYADRYQVSTTKAGPVHVFPCTRFTLRQKAMMARELAGFLATQIRIPGLLPVVLRNTVRRVVLKDYRLGIVE